MKKLNKVLSVLLTVAIAMSLFAVPVSANDNIAPQKGKTYATPTDQQIWTLADYPATVTYVVSADEETEALVNNTSNIHILGVLKIIYNADESAVYCIAEYEYRAKEATPTAGVTPDFSQPTVGIFKTTDEARTWKLLKTGYEIPIQKNWLAGDAKADIIASTEDAATIFFNDGNSIYMTTDGGENWVALANLFSWLTQVSHQQVKFGPGADGECYISTMDYAIVDGVQTLYVGTRGDATKTGVYTLAIAGQTQTWNDKQVTLSRINGEPITATQVLAVKADPAVTNGVVAIIAAPNGIFATFVKNSEQWNQTKNMDIAIAGDITNLEPTFAGIYKTSVWFTDDYATSGVFYVAFADNRIELEPLYKVTNKPFGAGNDTSVAVTVPTEKTVDGIAHNYDEFVDITGVGNAADPILVIGAYCHDDGDQQVIRSTNKGGSFKFADRPPMGNSYLHADAPDTAVTPTYIPADCGPHLSLLLLTDYLANGRALAGTYGLDGGVSLSTDYSNTWIQVSMIEQPIGSIISIAGDLYILDSLETRQVVWRNITGYWERLKVLGVNPASGTQFNKLAITADGTLFATASKPTDPADPTTSIQTEVYRSVDQALNWTIAPNPYYTNFALAEPYDYSKALFEDVDSFMVVVGNKIYMTNDFTNSWEEPVTINKVSTVTDIIATEDTYYAVGTTAGNPPVITVISASKDDITKWEVVAKSTAANGDNAYIGASTTAILTYNGSLFMGYKEPLTSTALIKVEDKFVYMNVPCMLGGTDTEGNDNLIVKPLKLDNVTAMVSDGQGSGIEGKGVVFVLDGNNDVYRYVGDNPKTAHASAINKYGPGPNDNWPYPTTDDIDDNCPVTATDLIIALDSSSSAMADATVNTKIYALGDNKICTYIDTFNKGVTGAAVGTYTLKENGYTTTLTWDAMPNAVNYYVAITDVKTLFGTALPTNPLYTDPASENYLGATPVIANVSSPSYVDVSLYDWYEVDVFNAATNSLTISGLDPQTKYYVQIWASAAPYSTKNAYNVYSFSMAKPYEFTTPYGAPVILTPRYHGTNTGDGIEYIEYTAVQITWAFEPYDRDNVGHFHDDNYVYPGDSVSYRIQLVDYTPGEDYYTKLINSRKIEIAANNFAYSPALTPDTSYAVRVCAVENGIEGQWSKITTFTTIEDTSKSDPVVITQGDITAAQPTSIIITEATCTIPAPQTIVVTEHTVTLTNVTTTTTAPDAGKAATPVYIWVIIAIGAILCIAVIVLIVRTRRTV
jgi:hypothetical protein